MPWTVDEDFEILVVVSEGERSEGGGVGDLNDWLRMDGALDDDDGWMAMGATRVLVKEYAMLSTSLLTEGLRWRDPSLDDQVRLSFFQLVLGVRRDKESDPSPLSEESVLAIEPSNDDLFVLVGWSG